MALVIGSGNEDEMDYAGALILKYSKIEKTTVPTVIVHREKESTFRIIASASAWGPYDGFKILTCMRTV